MCTGAGAKRECQKVSVKLKVHVMVITKTRKGAQPSTVSGSIGASPVKERIILLKYALINVIDVLEILLMCPLMVSLSACC